MTVRQGGRPTATHSPQCAEGGGDALTTVSSQRGFGGSFVVLVLAAEPLLGFGAPALADLFLEDLDAQGDALVADVDAGAGDQLAELRAGFAAERAAGREIDAGGVRERLGDRVGRVRDRFVGGGVVREAGVRIVERRQEALEGAVERLP